MFSLDTQRALKILRISAYVVGALIILTTVSIIFGSNGEIPLASLQQLLQLFTKVLFFGWPYLLKLLIASITTFWLPIILYFLISLFTTSRWERFYFSIVSLCIMILIVKSVFSNGFSISDVPTFFIFAAQFYLLLLWTFPKEFWNYFGFILWFIQSAIIILIPDLPTMLDDFGAIAAVFSFIFLFLHTVASLGQRLIDSFLVVTVRNGIYWMYRQFRGETGSWFIIKFHIIFTTSE